MPAGGRLPQTHRCAGWDPGGRKQAGVIHTLALADLCLQLGILLVFRHAQQVWVLVDSRYSQVANPRSVIAGLKKRHCFPGAPGILTRKHLVECLEQSWHGRDAQ